MYIFKVFNDGTHLSSFLWESKEILTSFPSGEWKSGGVHLVLSMPNVIHGSGRQFYNGELEKITLR
jgi:hypothetical protein